MELNYILSKEFTCDQCQRGFDRKYDLTRHLASTHGTSRTCQLCLKVLKSGQRKDMRVRHLVRGCPGFQFSYSYLEKNQILERAKKEADSIFY